MSEFPDFDPRRPFTRSDARAVGLSPAMLRGPRFRTLFRGVYVDSQVVPDLPVRCRAALLLLPGCAVVAGLSAAELLGLPATRRAEVEVNVPAAAHRRAHPGLVCVVRAGSVATTRVHGLPVVTGADLFLQLSPRLGLVELVVLGDAMVGAGMVGLAGLGRAAAAYRGPAAAHARRAARLVRERVDSPMETRVRLLLVLAGFPEPLVNATVAERYRPDLCWPGLRLIVEYDGRHHRADLDQWDHDIVRAEWFTRHGWTIVTAVARDVFSWPAGLLRRVHSAWLRAGGKPFELDPGWRAHFTDTNDAA